jgi:hypothetical protein
MYEPSHLNQKATKAIAGKFGVAQSYVNNLVCTYMNERDEIETIERLKKYGPAKVR